MPPAIIGAVIAIAASAAAAAGMIALSTAMMIAVAATVAASLLSRTAIPSIGSYASQQERKQILRSATAPHVHIYGETVLSGLMFFAEEQSGVQESNEWIHLAIAICAHEIESVNAIWLGDDLIETYGEFAQYEIHNNRQTVDPYMLQHCASWKDDMIGKGITWARISLKFDAEKFPSGLPNIRFKVKGKKVFDPRNNNTAWSDNAALCILDFYKNYLKIEESDINLNQFIQGSNISDQTVNDGPSGRKRYTINGSFDSAETQSGILDGLHLSCAGEPTYMAGKHGILVGAYYGPATMDLTAGQIVSDIKIVPEAAFAQKINTVTGTYVDPLSLYAETDYPPVVVEQYVNEDGSEFTSDLKLRFVNNVYQAQQLAQIKISRTRIGRTLSFTMNMSGYKYRPGYYVNLILPQLGIDGQEFRITEWSMSPDNGVDVVLKQETAEVWKDSIGKPIERPDITDFPVAGVTQPMNLSYQVTQIGEVVQGILSWTNIGDIVYNIVVIRQGGVSVQTTQTPGESVNITGLLRGTYEASISAVNRFGQKSPEAFLIIVVEAPDMPVSVEVGQGYFSITLKPRLAQLVNVSTQFDFWTSGETRLSSPSTNIVEQQASRRGIGQLFVSDDLKVGHTYWWYIRSINAFGTSNFLEIGALCDSNLEGLLEGIFDEFMQSNAGQQLLGQIETISNAEIESAIANDADIYRRRLIDGKNSASITEIRQVSLDTESAFSQFKQEVQVTLDDQQAIIQTKATTIFDSTGGSATYSVNAGIIYNGNYYDAGMVIGLETSGNTVKSIIGFNADTFILTSGLSGAQYSPFVVRNGQVVINEAIIANATIKSAQIEDYLQSTNWVSESTGIQIGMRTGTIEINGAGTGSARMKIKNNRIDVYDEKGLLRVRMGEL